MMSHDQQRATHLLSGARRILVLSGAGISTAAGIPDFRGPAGLWTADPDNERISTLSWYLTDSEVRRRAWQRRFSSPVWQSEPTAAHRSLAKLGDRLLAVVTQNTDGLHQLAGTAEDRVIEIHGNARRWRCEDCGATGPMVDALARIAAGDPDPHCRHCGGITRATTILFEEALDPDALDAAMDAAEECDLVLAVGSTLSVHPAAGLYPLAIGTGARGIIINQQPTSYDHLADVVLAEDINEVLPRLVDPLDTHPPGH